jgi:SAM-dependent methyltransferase
MASGVMTTSNSKQQFNEIVAIIGLPRSGTTLATSVFDAHPFCVACYEPWNRVKGTDLSPEQTPEDLVAKFELNAAPDANIFVLKETSVDSKSIQWLTKFLQHNAKSHRVQIVWSLRNYRHSYLSFVEGAREWWGHTDMKTGAESYTQWVERARHGTIGLLGLYQKYPGAIYAYESLAENASTTLPRLMGALGLEFYPQQVDYLEHYSPKQVRGDVSMSKNPRPISDDSMKKREMEWAKYETELAGSDGDALRQQLDQFWQAIQKHIIFAGQVPTTLIPDRLRSLVLRPGHEYRETFSGKKEWEEFNRENCAVTDRGIIENFAASIMRTGIKFLDKTVKPNELQVVDGDYRNSFVNEGLASRSRGLVVELLRAFMVKKIGPKKIRIFTPEAHTGLTRLLAKHFPKLQTFEHLHKDKQRKESLSREYRDLAALACKDASFDYMIIDDVFQSVPNLDNVLREAHRVLAPGGVLFATFPFAIESEEHLVKATRNLDGSINYMVPQEHGNGYTEEQSAVVFQIPGWNILADCRNVGFVRAEFLFLCSPTRGMLASDISGIMILKAEKAA